MGWELVSWDVQSSLLLFQATTSYSLAQKCLKVHPSAVGLFAPCSEAVLAPGHSDVRNLPQTYISS